MLEERIIQFCAPTLAAMKTGSLFNTHGFAEEDILPACQKIEPILAERGLYLRIFYKKTRCPLIYVYRKTALVKDLKKNGYQNFLSLFGYHSLDIDAALDHLALRIKTCDGFPHEIGLFLSYPLSDVRSFIEKGVCNCKLCGHWCAYSDIETARCTFNRFDRCTNAYKTLYGKGYRLKNLALAG